jgi:hypothetical protein
VQPLPHPSVSPLPAISTTLLDRRVRPATLSERLRAIRLWLMRGRPPEGDARREQAAEKAPR